MDEDCFLFRHYTIIVHSIFSMAFIRFHLFYVTETNGSHVMETQLIDFYPIYLFINFIIIYVKTINVMNSCGKIVCTMQIVSSSTHVDKCV